MADGVIKTDWKVGDLAVHRTYGNVRVLEVREISVVDQIHQLLTVEMVHAPEPRSRFPVGWMELQEMSLYLPERKGGS